MPSVETLALAALGLLGLGSVALCLLALIPKTAKVARDALPILLTEILIVGTAVAAFWLGGWGLILALIILAIRVVYEVQVVAVPPRLRLLLFPGLPLVIFCIAGANGAYGAWLLLAFLLVETFDSYALLGGKFLGKTKAFPVLSPNKTIEGLAAGAVMLMTTAGIGAWLLSAPVPAALGLALITAPLAIAGDLLASRIKRRKSGKPEMGFPCGCSKSRSVTIMLYS